MIPSDLTARLRLLTEASFFSKEPPQVGALRSSQSVSEDLPDFQPGQRIVATLREARGDDTFRALINGREFTLTLPKHHAKAGQTLDLIVTQATPRAVLATVADGGIATVSSASLSQTGRLISFLLTGQPPVSGVTIAGGQSVLPTPPSAGAAAAPLLRQAVVESGLFYESHLARWLAGAVTTESLLRQPQSRLTAGARAAAAGTGAASTPAPSPGPASTPAPASGQSPGGGALRSLGADAAPVNQAGQSAAAQRQPGQTQNNPIPDRLLPIVHQQLDALATNNYAWQGAIWPGQEMHWEIEERPGDGGDGDADETSDWNTTLRLLLPRLGGIEAQLQLTAAGVAVRLAAADGNTVETLSAAREQLARALEAADVPLTGMSVERSQGVEPES